MLFGKVSKFYITFILVMFPDWAPCLVSRVLRDRRQSKSESVLQILPLVHCAQMIVTSSLFVRFEHMSNNWKSEKVN
jgi:hypothetical protein